MTNRMTEDLGNGKFRTRDSNAPALETANSRRWVFGPLRTTADVPANANVFPTFCGIANGVGIVPTMRKGRLLGMMISPSNLITGGTISITPRLKNVDQAAVAVVMSATNTFAPPKTVLFSTPLEFAKDDSLLLHVTSSADLNPAGALSPNIFLLIEWDPE